MKRVLLVQPSLQPPGGGNGVAAWVLQALVADQHHPGYRVTVLSWTPVDIEPINRFFGTHLRRDDFETIEVPRAWRAIADRLPTPATLIKLSLLMRYTRRISGPFDVVFGVYNETDYGRRGIQYVHYPTYLRPRPAVDLRWYHARAGLNLYYAFADRLAGFSLERMKANLTLVNSDWTGRHVGTSLGITTRTLYPPVVDPAPPLPARATTRRPARWRAPRGRFLAVSRRVSGRRWQRPTRGSS